MKRDLAQYQRDYMNHDYEVFQAKYRRRDVLTFLQKVSNRFENPKILEIGCGSEPIFTDFQDFGRMDVVEPGEQFSEIAARKRSEFPSANIQIHPVAIQDFFPKTTYDGILCAGLLHELPDPQQLLVHIRKLCAKDTLVYFNVPNANSFHRLLALEAGLIRDVRELSGTQIRLQQHQTFTLEELREMIADGGFEFVEERSIIFKPFTHNQMLDLLKYNIISHEVCDALSNMVVHASGLGSELVVIARRRAA